MDLLGVMKIMLGIAEEGLRLAYNATLTGLLAWKRGQPGQMGNQAALTVVTSAGGKARHLIQQKTAFGRFFRFWRSSVQNAV